MSLQNHSNALSANCTRSNDTDMAILKKPVDSPAKIYRFRDVAMIYPNYTYIMHSEKDASGCKRMSNGQWSTAAVSLGYVGQTFFLS